MTRRIVTSVFVAAVTVASVAGLAIVTAPSAGADPYEQASVGLEYSHKSLGVAAELFEAFGKSGLAKASLGFAFLTSILGPLFGLGNSGPTIEDVLDKLDQMSEQLDQIKEQLNEINTKIEALQEQVKEATKLVANTACANLLQTGLDPYLATIDDVQAKYDSMLTTAQTLPSSPDPQATVATLKEDFTNLATAAMGPNSNTPAGGPLYRAINGIHRGLMGSGVDDKTGVIYVCGESGLLNFRAGPQTFVDDRSYYAYITAVVNFYENYELLGLSLLQEAASYRVTDTLADKHVAIPAGSAQSPCALEQAQSGDPAQICRDTAKLTKDVYGFLVDEWTLTGRPYSDDNVIMQDGSAALGVGGIEPILWVRDPKAEPASAATGTWTSDPNKTITYDGFNGFKPARLDQWENLQKAEVAGHGCGGTIDLYACMEKSGFKNVAGTYWMPQQSVGGLKLPVPDTDALGVLGYGGNLYPFSYAGPDLTLRCFVDAQDALHIEPFACSQSWFSETAGVREAASKDRHGDLSEYIIKWGFAVGNFPDVASNAYTFQYDTYNPYSGTGTYGYDSTTGSYPAWINQPPYGGFPAFLGPLEIPVVKYCQPKKSGGEYPCGRTDTTYSPKATTEQLWQTAPVNTTNSKTQQCVNTVEVPQLCAPINGASPTAEDQPFESWINNTIPNPSLPSPVAKAAPTIKDVGGTPQCGSGGWEPVPAGWTYGEPRALATSWTGTSGAMNFTTPAGASSILADNKLDLHAFLTAAKFDPTKPFLLTCTVSARWEKLVNTGSALSANYQVTPKGSTYVLTQVPDAPTIGAAAGGGKDATVHWTVGASPDAPISSFVITPYLKGVAQTPLKFAAGGPGLSGAAGSKDMTTIEGLTPGTAYTFSVTAVAIVPGTTTDVQSTASSQSEPVAPKEVAPLTPINKPTTTTTTLPLTPLKTTTTTTPLTPLNTTTTTMPPPSTTTTVPSGDAFGQHVVRTSDDTATATFTPAATIASVDLHYRVGSGAQQSFRMEAQPNGSYTQLIRGLSANAVVTYHFTYIPTSTGLAVDSKDFSYTQP
jgi:hypothetical protein